MTFLELAKRTIEQVGKPLSPTEIWEKATELKITDNVESVGKTPWNSVGARIYISIRDNKDSEFIQISKRPAKFYLKKLLEEKDKDKLLYEIKNSIDEEERNISKNKSFNERDLHPLLVRYINSDMHFKAYSKTIFHENSRHNRKGYNEWLHPDVVGVYFPFDDYLNETQEIQKVFSSSTIKLFSFELKISISFSNLRQSYFQAISNSSWANEGYLVTLDIEEDNSLYDEIRRLNNAFGIGVIRLDSDDIEQSEILYPARENNDIDWDTVNRLLEENSIFKEFIRDITEDIKIGKAKSKYDKIYDDNEMEKYLRSKNIKSKRIKNS